MLKYDLFEKSSKKYTVGSCYSYVWLFKDVTIISKTSENVFLI